MKNVLRLLTFTAVAATFALPAFAQTTQPSPAATTAASAAQQPSTVCVDLYNKWRDNRKGDAATQKVAYEAGKQYLAQCGSDEYVSYVQKWVTAYDKAARDIDFYKAANDKKYDETFRLGKQLLSEDANNMAVLLTLANAGLGNASAGTSAIESLNADTINYAKAALRIAEDPSKTVDKWAPYASKDDAIGWLNYTLGVLNVKRAPKEAAGYFVKAAQTNFSAKQDPALFYFLATAYQGAEYKPLADDYQATCAGKDLTDECKTKLDTMNLVVDRIIDAYARAIAFGGAKPQKAEWMKQLTSFYKFRHNDSETGLNELIAGIQSKPLLLPSMQTMPAPAPSPGTTPAGTTPSMSSSNPASGGNMTNTATPAASSSATKPATTAPAAAAKPATTQPGSAKPKTTSSQPTPSKTGSARRP